MHDHPFFWAHESAHQQLGHRPQRIALWLVLFLCGPLLAYLVNYSLWASPLFSIWVITICSPFWLLWMRLQEHKADLVAIQETGFDSAQNALNQTQMNAKSLLGPIFSTHPSPKQRIRYLKKHLSLYHKAFLPR